MDPASDKLLTYGPLGIFCAVLLVALVAVARAYVQLQKDRLAEILAQAARTEERETQKRTSIDANTASVREHTHAINAQNVVVANLTQAVNANTAAVGSMRDVIMVKGRSSDRMQAVKRE